MKTNIYIFISIILMSSGMLATGCSSETIKSAAEGNIGDKCSKTAPCLGTLICAYEMCMEPEDPCVKIECEDGILCRDGQCQTTSECGESTCSSSQVCKDEQCVDLCGSRTCTKGEFCESNQCKPSNDCAGVKCAKGEVCQKDVCREAGDCGGAKCTEDEVCHNSLCYPAGDCDGAGCGDNEVCHENVCTPKGDCDGIECQNGLVCDTYNQICRKPGDCGGVDCGELAFCMEDSYCMDREKCGDIYCEGGYICSESGECVPGQYCVDGRDRCGGDCCTKSQFCGEKDRCCENSESCGQGCCDSDQVCINEVCRMKCDEGNERCTALDGKDICCSNGEICVSNQCFAPAVSCVDDYQCETGQYCEPTLKTCLPQPGGPVCQMTQKGGEVRPTPLWHWGVDALVPPEFSSHQRVMSAPMVADVNGDGNVEVVFNSWAARQYVGGGILRIVDGKTGQTLHSSNGSPMTDGGSQVAIGDIRKDIAGLEIVTCVCTTGDCEGANSGQLRIALYDSKASQIWQTAATSYNECGQSGPGIADFDGDGNPEVFSRYNVFNGQTGELIARFPCGDDEYWHARCDYPTAADLDGDGLPELVGGNIAFKVDVANKTLKQLYYRTDQYDGYPAVADIDLDSKPEIVVVRSANSTIMAFNADGTNHWSAPVTHAMKYGGPPTIANIDSTKEPEIAFAGQIGYIAFRHDGTELWRKPTHDFSSAKTGSSVFDFDGDGKAEVVYADECFLRVYDGETGNVRFCQYNTNATHWEYPVIADVDGDNHAEILISANPAISSCSITADTGLDECTQALISEGVLNTTITGLRAFASPNRDWVNTRKIYNQHAYSITNVSDDGTIPQKVRNNWSISGLNNFRLNMQPGAAYLPDLEIRNLSAPRTCSELTPVYFDVVNVGWASAEAGITVHVRASESAAGPFAEIGTVKTTRTLKASESEALKFEYPEGTINASVIYLEFSFGDDAPTECKSDNNTADCVLNCTVVN